MKKRMIIYITIGLLLLPLILAQNVPNGDSAFIQQMIQEHKNTRKFFSDELTRQRNEFNKVFEDKAEYYKREADDLINNAVWKLGLLWGGIVIFVFGMSNFLARKLDKRKWNKMLESAKAEIMADVNKQKAKNDEIYAQKQQALNNQTTQLKSQYQQFQQEKQKVYQQKQQIAQAKPQLFAMQQKINQQQKELQEVMKKIDLFNEGGQANGN